MLLYFFSVMSNTQLKFSYYIIVTHPAVQHESDILWISLFAVLSRVLWWVIFFIFIDLVSVSSVEGLALAWCRVWRCAEVVPLIKRGEV